MRRINKRKSVAIATLLCVFCFMSVGYAAFSTQLAIYGTATITGTWDVHIQKVEVAETNGTGENAEVPSFTINTTEVSANLYKPGDFVSYRITVVNEGTIEAKLSDVIYSDAGLGAIKISHAALDESLKSGETTDIIVKVEYDSTYTGEVQSYEGQSVITISYVQV